MGEVKRKKTEEQHSSQELLARLDALLNEEWQVSLPADEPVKESPVQQPEPLQPAPQAEEKESKMSVSAELRRREWLIMCHDIVYILAAVLLLFTFFIRMSRVEGNSMNPTLVHHDRMLLLSNVWYSEPQRGDIVVARVRGFSTEPIVKRVIAVEGDTVDIDFDRGIVYVNGQALVEPYIQSPTYNHFGGSGIGYPLVVEKGHVFLMGDNRNDSYDSRYGMIGQVDERCILGKVFFISVPGKDPDTGKRDFSRFGLIG